MTIHTFLGIHFEKSIMRIPKSAQFSPIEFFKKLILVSIFSLIPAIISTWCTLFLRLWICEIRPTYAQCESPYRSCGPRFPWQRHVRITWKTSIITYVRSYCRAGLKASDCSGDSSYTHLSLLSWFGSGTSR